MKKIILNIQKWLIALTALLIGAVGCTPESEEGHLGLIPTASFEVVKDDSKSNTYALKSTTSDAFIFLWDKGKGRFESGSEVDSVFFPDAGEYEIRLVAVGAGGQDTTDVQTVVVETSDPVAGNLVRGGKMEEGDEDEWSTFTIGAGVDFSVTDGAMVGVGGGWGHAGFYQTIDVVAGKSYRFSALVSGSGATDTWYEVYFGADQPMDGSDYTSGGNQIGLNTWTGCGATAFTGDILDIGCVGDLSGTDGTISFETSGTIYLVVKSGGAWLGDTGIAMDDIEFRGTN